MSRLLRTFQVGMGWLPERAGGLNRVFFNLVNSLPEVGVHVDGLVDGHGRAEQETQGAIQSVGSDEEALPLRWRRLSALGRKRLQTQGYDLFASHFAPYAWPLVRHVALPQVVHFHGPWALEGAIEGEGRAAHWAKAFLERGVYRRAERLIVLSDAFRDILHERYGVPLEKIRKVPGGVETNRFAVAGSRAEARARLGWAQGRPTVFAIRRLVPRMGLDVLIEAIAAVRQQVPEVQVMIAGRGPQYEPLQAQIAALGLGEQVQLLGFLPGEDLPYAYRAADLSIVPTQALEGFGLITVESLAAGTPVMVTPVTSLPEVVSGLSRDLILPGTDARALAEGLTQALQGNLDLPDAQRCHAYARQYFDWSVIARQVRAVYEEVV